MAPDTTASRYRASTPPSRPSRHPPMEQLASARVALMPDGSQQMLLPAAHSTHPSHSTWREGRDPASIAVHAVYGGLPQTTMRSIRPWHPRDCLSLSLPPPQMQWRSFWLLAPTPLTPHATSWSEPWDLPPSRPPPKLKVSLQWNTTHNPHPPIRLKARTEGFTPLWQSYIQAIPTKEDFSMLASNT